MADLAGLPWYRAPPALPLALLPGGGVPPQPLAARALRRLRRSPSASAGSGSSRHLLSVGPFSLEPLVNARTLAAPRRHPLLLPAHPGAARQALAEGRPRGGAADPVRPAAVRALREGRHLDRERHAPGEHRGRRLLRRHRARRGAPRDRGRRRGGQGHAGGAPHGAPPGQPPHPALGGPARRGARGQAQRPPVREHPLEPAHHALLRGARHGDRPARLRERRPQPALPPPGRAARRRGSAPPRWRSGSRRRRTSRR